MESNVPGMKNAIVLSTCMGCAAGAIWAGYHLLFMALGKGPLEIDEPNVWLARGEFLFTVLIVLLGLVGFVYTVLKLRQGKCPLCGSDIAAHLPIRQCETANSADKTARIGGVYTANVAVPTDRKGAADA